MDIKNVTQFRNFILAKGMVDLDSAFKNVFLCVEDYSRACGGCGSDSDKRRIYERCNRLYIHAVHNAIPNYLDKVFQNNPDVSVAFYRETDLIKSFRR